MEVRGIWVEVHAVGGVCDGIWLSFQAGKRCGERLCCVVWESKVWSSVVCGVKYLQGVWCVVESGLVGRQEKDLVKGNVV